MNVLTEQNLAFWRDNGYVIVRNAVPQENVDAVVDTHLGIHGDGS